MLLPMVGLGAAASLLAMALLWVPRSQTTIAMVHIRDVFEQLRSSFEESQSPEHSEIDSERFVSLASSWKIDWNSCSLSDGSIKDPWGNKVKISIGDGQIHLRSAGPDSTFFTPDDTATAFHSNASSH